MGLSLNPLHTLDSALHTADSALHTADSALHTAEQLVENGPTIFGNTMKCVLQNGEQLAGNVARAAVGFAAGKLMHSGFPGLGPLGPHLPLMPLPHLPWHGCSWHNPGWANLQRHGNDGSTHCWPPSCPQHDSLTVDGNTVNTGRYTITASNCDDGSLTVRDNTNGESFKVWGDPHISTDKGDKTDFQHQPATILLDDGTKITIDPTKNSGVNYINNVTITKGNDAVEIGGFRGNLQTQALPGEGHYLDDATPDGTVLRPVNGNIDQLQLPDGTLISGNNVANIDSYANQSQLGSDGQTLIDEGHQLVQEGMQLVQQGNVQQGMQLIQDGAALEMQGGQGTNTQPVSTNDTANTQPLSGDTDQSLIDDGHQLVQEGLQLIQQGNVQQGMQLIQDGTALEMQGGKGTGQGSSSGQAQASAQPVLSSSNNANAQPAVSSSSNANAQPLSGGSKVQANQIYQYLISLGFTPAQAAGILGNMQVESGFNTGAYNQGEGAIGLCQWEGGRRTALEQFAASQGKPASDWKVQVDFMMKELQGSESGALSRLKGATTAGDAAAIFDQYYERSAGTSRSQRVADANSIAAQMA